MQWQVQERGHGQEQALQLACGMGQQRESEQYMAEVEAEAKVGLEVEQMEGMEQGQELTHHRARAAICRAA